MRRAAADRARLLRICVFLQVGIPAWLAAPAAAQVATRLDIVEAEAHGAASSRDLLILRSGTHSGDSETARMAVRALGRIERPSALPDILLQLRHSLPEVRAEAANAAAQSAQGFKTGKNAPVGVSVQSVQAALIARLSVEDEASVRAALCEAVARLPYKSAGDVDRAETTILDVSSTHGANVTDRLGVARGLEALVRLHSELRPPSSRAIAWLRTSIVATAARPGMEITHDERIRRLALEALIGAHAVDDDLIAAAIHDPDAQVRRLAMLAVGSSEVGMGSVPNGLLDITPIVRLEALRAVRTRGANWACEAALKSLTDSDMTVALLAIDQLSTCGRVPEAVAALERAVADRSEADAGRGWHRTAHALVALAGAAPERIGDALNLSATSGTWQLRMYAARAAAIVGDQSRLETLAADADDRVANAALAGLQRPLRPVPGAKEEIAARADRRRFAAARRAAGDCHDPRRRAHRTRALHQRSAVHRSPLRAPGGVGLLRRAHASIASRPTSSCRRAAGRTATRRIRIPKSACGRTSAARSAFRRRIPVTRSSSSIWWTTRDSIIATRSSRRCSTAPSSWTPFSKAT